LYTAESRVVDEDESD
jgi:hypothetical protein